MTADNSSNITKPSQGGQAIPATTQIYYSKKKAMRGLIIVAVVIFGCLLYMIACGNSSEVYFFGCSITFFCLIMGFSRFANYRNKHAQIYLDNEGIQTVSIPFFYWKDVKGEDVVKISSNKTTGTYLVYEHPKGLQRFQIDFLDTTTEELLALLKVYRGRSEEKF